MKTKTNKRKNILSVLVVMVMLVATLLTACSSGETAAAPAKEETPAVETSKEAEPEVTTEPETTEEAEPETTTEEVAEEPELETEAVEDEEEVDVYAQIDMESTLPGIEWIQTFDGIIDEPKLVVFNDSTNKKIILEELQEVEFYDDDTLAVYIPKDRGNIITNDYLELYEEIEYYDNIVTLRKIPSIITRGGYISARCIDIEFDGEPMTLYCYLKLMGNP